MLVRIASGGNATHYESAGFKPSTPGWAAPVVMVGDSSIAPTGGTLSIRLTVLHREQDGGYSETLDTVYTSSSPDTATYTGKYGVIAYTFKAWALSTFTDSGGNTLLSAISSGAVNFSNMLYDRVSMKVSGTITSAAGNMALAGSTVALERVAEYALTGAYLDTPELLRIDYTASEGFQRGDDELCIIPYFFNGEPLSLYARVRTFRGGLGNEYGSLYLPIQKLHGYVPGIGDTITLYLQLQIGVKTFQTVSLATLTIGNAIECDTPAITASHDGGALKVSCVKSGDKGYAGTERYSISLGGAYTFDTVDAGEGEETTLYPPLDTEFELTATGYSADGDISAQATDVFTVPSGGYAMIDGIADGLHLEVRYNQEFDDSRKAEVEIVKLARDLPSAFYGVGVSDASVSVSGVVIRGEQDPEDFRALATHSPVLLRIPGGDRRYVAVTDVAITTLPGAFEINLSCAEVAQ